MSHIVARKTTRKPWFQCGSFLKTSFQFKDRPSTDYWL